MHLALPRTGIIKYLGVRSGGFLESFCSTAVSFCIEILISKVKAVTLALETYFRLAPAQ
jgi:hypothetical protein